MHLTRDTQGVQREASVHVLLYALLVTESQATFSQESFLVFKPDVKVDLPRANRFIHIYVTDFPSVPGARPFLKAHENDMPAGAIRHDACNRKPESGGQAELRSQILGISQQYQQQEHLFLHLFEKPVTEKGREREVLQWPNVQACSQLKSRTPNIF